MVPSILVVCVGNICRSPIAERLLAAKLAERGSSIRIASAGLAAVTGHAADADAMLAASAQGVSLDGHVARQFTYALGAEHALILVMESGHRRDILKTAPDLFGRIMLFDHWTGGTGIADPYRRGVQFHQDIAAQIDAAATVWVDRLAT